MACCSLYVGAWLCEAYKPRAGKKPTTMSAKTTLSFKFILYTNYKDN
jgi:hypothetical protein